MHDHPVVAAAYGTQACASGPVDGDGHGSVLPGLDGDDDGPGLRVGRHPAHVLVAVADDDEVVLDDTGLGVAGVDVGTGNSVPRTTNSTGSVMTARSE